MAQAGPNFTTSADLPAISPEMLLLGAIYTALGPKKRAMVLDIIERESMHLKVRRLRGPRPVLGADAAYHQAQAFLTKLEAL